MCLAVPGKVITITGEDPILRMARVAYGGVVKEASLAFVPEANPGAWVLVHAGVAIGVIDEAEAAHMLAALESLEEPMPPDSTPVSDDASTGR